MLEKIINEPLFLAYLLGYDKVQHPYHERWIRLIWAHGTDVLQAHRNSYKTTCTVISIIWGLLVKPETRILLIRKAKEESSAVLEEIMSHYERPALRAIYRECFGIEEPRNLDRWSASRGLALATKTKPSKERNIEAAGIGKHRTGAHYDLIIPDDIVTVIDRYSEAERTRVKIYCRELSNILNNDGIGVKYRGTPWHEDDAFSILPKPEKYPISMNFIPELTPERIEQLKAESTPSLWSINYDLEHMPDEKRIFADAKFEDPPDEAVLIGYLDPAFSDKPENDCSALTAGTASAGKINIVFGRIWQKEIDEIYDEVEAAYHELGLSLLVVESNAAQIAVGKEMARRGCKVMSINQHKNKHYRIVHFARKYWPKIFFSKNIDEPYFHQLMGYNISASKRDAADSLAGLVQYFVTKRKEISYREVNIR